MVLGKARLPPLTSPPPGTPSLPARAGSAKMARMPLPPFWFRSRPLPTLMAAGESAWYHSASSWIRARSTPVMRSASARETRRTRSM